jgi:RNA polymerase sigma-70 factor (ECF subfamily)
MEGAMISPSNQAVAVLPPLVVTPADAERAARAQLERLFADYQTPILNYLYRLVGDANLAEDLAQEAFTRAWQASARLRYVENPRAWLYRIATNLAHDHHRRARLLSWLPLGEHSQAGATAGPEEGDDPFDGERVRRALLRLAPEYRIPLVLYVCEEFSSAEIAATLSISRDAVKQRLVRARERLRLLLQAHEGMAPDA